MIAVFLLLPPPVSGWCNVYHMSGQWRPQQLPRCCILHFSPLFRLADCCICFITFDPRIPLPTSWWTVVHLFVILCPLWPVACIVLSGDDESAHWRWWLWLLLWWLNHRHQYPVPVAVVEAFLMDLVLVGLVVGPGGYMMEADDVVGKKRVEITHKIKVRINSVH